MKRNALNPLLKSLALLALMTFYSHACAYDASKENCKDTNINQDEIYRDKPAEIPNEYENFVYSNITTLTVKTFNEDIVCSDISYWYKIDDYWISKDQRFFGYHGYGYEAEGHFVIDRASSGTILETGVRPVFSKDSSMMASIYVTDADWGNLSGLAIWRINRDNNKKIFAMDMDYLHLNAIDWKIDKWIDSKTILLSSVDHTEYADLQRERSDIIEYDEIIANLNRQYHLLVQNDDSWEIKKSDDFE